MNFEPVARIAEALLYEGYLLYPYRASSVKNQQRWTFGCLLPPTFPQSASSAEGSSMQTECLLLGNAGTQLEIKVRFLHLTTRLADSLQTSQEAIAREVTTPCLNLHEAARHPYCQEFVFPASRQSDGVLVHSQEVVTGNVEVSAEPLDHGAFRLRIRLQNLTPLVHGERFTREEALAWSLLSCHLLLGTRDGEFLSMTDPPERFRASAAGCRNLGVWPVLAGDEGRRDTILAAPIILDDYPRIACQSQGDFFDSTEIDEMLTLRIRTLTNEEKQAMTRADPRAERMLERCESMPHEQLLSLHGAWQNDDDTPVRLPLASLQVGTVDLAPGMRVRLKPKGNADIFDLALSGKTAQILSLEQDFENRLYVSVALDDDPGKDLGVAGKPGHRFFFRPEEVEPLQEEKQLRRILVAGIGNVFFGDDAFGVEVVRRLAARTWPAGVVVKDFSIRGFDLACALQEGYEAVILVDAVQRGKPPGTLHVLELDPESEEPMMDLDMHHLDPVQVLRLARQMGGPLPRLRLVGCEPETMEPAEGAIVNLSESVQRAVSQAVEVVGALVEELRAGKA